MGEPLLYQSVYFVQCVGSVEQVVHNLENSWQRLSCSMVHKPLAQPMPASRELSPSLISPCSKARTCVLPHCNGSSHRCVLTPDRWASETKCCYLCACDLFFLSSASRACCIVSRPSAVLNVFLHSLWGLQSWGNSIMPRKMASLGFPARVLHP